MNGLKERLLRLKRPEAGMHDGAVAELDARAGERRAGAWVAADGERANAGAGSGDTGGMRLAHGEGLAADADIRALAASGWESVGGVRIEWNASGSFLLRERVYETDYRHGHYALGDLAELADQLGALAAGGGESESRSRPVELERLLFFDTETTGLGIGAGNLPFMIGLGYYAGGRFVVQQLFIRNPAEEIAMLAYFERLLERFTHIVSYNGRSFDWPIVQSRFVLARRRRGRDEWRHIDLLYPVRSLWKTVLPSCRLGAVEADKLGFRRKDDVPGSMAPALYVQYLAERDPRAVAGVFAHNEYDIVSLAALAVHMAKLLNGEEPAAGLGDEELLRLSLWLDKLQRPELAERMRARLGLRLLDGGIRPDRERLLLELAAAYKKRTRHASAAELWRRFLAERGGGFACPVEPYIEMAMYCEHRERRYGDALAYAEEALNRVWKRASLSRVDERQRELADALQRRIRRLRDKQRREAARAGEAAAKAARSGRGDAVPTRAQPSDAVWPKAARKQQRVKPEYVRESLL